MKRIFVSSIIIAIICILVLSPMSLAAKPTQIFSTGQIIDISPGWDGTSTVDEAGSSGRWVVVDRQLTIKFDNIDSEFTLTYKANVDSTQAGNLHGQLIVGEDTFNVVGKIQPDFTNYVVIFVDNVPIPCPYLTMSGQWSATNGGQMNGEFEGGAYYIPYGYTIHVGDFLPAPYYPNNFVMTTK